MRELDFDQQEQLANLKAFWESNRLWILALLTTALLGIGGYQGWQTWQTRQSAQAVSLFESAEKAIEGKRWSEVITSAEGLRAQYPRSAYTVMTALLAAKASSELGKPEEAKQSLRWIIDKHSDHFLSMVARLRLAALLAEEKSLDEALKILPLDDQALPKDQASFAGLIADLRGDILMAKQERKEARLAYARALAVMDPKDPWRPIVQVKLDSLPE